MSSVYPSVSYLQWAFLWVSWWVLQWMFFPALKMVVKTPTPAFVWLYCWKTNTEIATARQPFAIEIEELQKIAKTGNLKDQVFCMFWSKKKTINKSMELINLWFYSCMNAPLRAASIKAQMSAMNSFVVSILWRNFAVAVGQTKRYELFHS